MKKGIGFATFMHGAGFTGSGEVHLASVVAVEATAEGTRPRADREHRDRPGHEHDLLADRRRRARHRLPDDVESCSRTPRVVPNSGPTVASRTCMVVGKLVETAALGVRQTLIDAGYLPADAHARRVPARRAGATSRAFGAAARRRASTSRRPGCGGTTRSTQGDAYGTYAWAVYVAEVTVDIDDLGDRASTISSPCRRSAR